MAKNRRLDKNKLLRRLTSKSQKICKSFFNKEYIYSEQEAMAELGLDKELVNQLLEDYVVQIINASNEFEEFIYVLQTTPDSDRAAVYNQIRDLAHKNLGVAKNLRIESAIKVLQELMAIENLEELHERVEILRACAILLKPESAYKTIKELGL